MAYDKIILFIEILKNIDTWYKQIYGQDHEYPDNVFPYDIYLAC